jgi:hypothetical protein
MLGRGQTSDVGIGQLSNMQPRPHCGRPQVSPSDRERGWSPTTGEPMTLSNFSILGEPQWGQLGFSS